jgi:hypothetical protein
MAAQAIVWVVWRRQHGSVDEDVITMFDRVDARYA